MRKTFFFLVLISQNLFAQLSDQQYLELYKAGVVSYNSGDYEDAYQTLTKLTQPNYNNAVVPYAYLYAAAAAEKKGSKYQSRILLKNVLQNHEDWDKLNQARLIYAVSNLKEGYYEEGIKAIDEIDDETLKELKIGILEQYIQNVKTITSLKNLYNKYPNYKPIAEALVNKIQNNRYNTKADLELSDLLTNRFNLSDTKEEVPAKTKKPSKKKPIGGELNFGLFLPFNLVGSGLPNAGSLYVYDLYAGMQIAAEKLAEEGVFLNLHTFDIGKNAGEFKKAEQKDGFEDLDLVVGPLYPVTNNLAQGFINKNNILQVHPLSNNLTLLRNSNNTFLIQPSYTKQSGKILDYMESQGGQNAVSVYFGNSSKDSLFAHIYAETAKSKGYTINRIEKFSNQKLKQELGHVFLAGDKEMGLKFLQNMLANNNSSEVAVTASSFSWDRINSSYFTDRVSIIYPEFVNREKESVKDFEKRYFQNFSAIPSYYSYLGYDLAYYFASMLKDGRDLLKLNLELGEYSNDYMLSGYDFSEPIKQNNLVPIVKYVNGNFEEVSR